MKQILENLDLSDELKTELTESFDKAVLVEALKLSEQKETEYKEYLEAQLAESKVELETKLNDYLDRVVEEFVNENEFGIAESVNKQTYETLLEGFGAVLVAAGVEMKHIVEATEEDEGLEESDDSSEKVDSLMSEIFDLKKINAKLLKTGLIREATENMTSFQKEKFMKLAQMLEFDEKQPEVFISRLDTVVESVQSQKETKVDVITEAVTKPSTVKYVSKATHLY